MPFNLQFFNTMKPIQAITLVSLLLAVLGSRGSTSIYTHVTCMYDLKRGDIINKRQDVGFKGKSRKYQQYLKYFEQLLMTDANLIIFGNKDLYSFVWQRRDPRNTVFVRKQMDQLTDMWFTPYIKRIRRQKLQDPSFSLKTHISYQRDQYNALMFSKMYLLEQAIQHDQFSSDYFIWIDGGLNHNYPGNIFYPRNNIKQIFQYLRPQWFFFTFQHNSFFQGYENDSSRYVGFKTNRIVQGGIYGGQIETVRDARCAFQNLLRLTLQNGDMFSDECVLSMLPQKYPFLFPMLYFLPSFRQLYQLSEKKLSLLSSYNRKPQNHRLFKANFDNNDNIIVAEKRVHTKMVVSTQEIATQVPKVPSQTQLTCHHQAYSFFLLVGEHRNLYKQMFLREMVLLLILVVLYLAVKIRSKEQETVDLDI